MNINLPPDQSSFIKDPLSPATGKKTATPLGTSHPLPRPQAPETAQHKPITAFKVPGPTQEPTTELDDVDKMVLNETDAEAIASRDGVLWECIKRKKGTGDGYIYTFRLRDEFLDATKAVETLWNIHPATEPLANYLSLVWSEFDNDETGQILQKLGYQLIIKNEESFLELPDKAELLSRWNELRSNWKKEPPLEQLDIKYSIGVASDEEFVQMYCKHDALLSTGTEFVHDQFFHVMRTILCKLDTTKDWSEIKKGRVKALEQFGQNINRARGYVNEVLEGTKPLPGKFDENERETFARLQRNLVHADVFTGVFADIFSAFQPRNLTVNFMLNFDQLEKVPINTLSEYKDYFAKRFPSKDGDIDMLWLWNNLKDIIAESKSK